MLTKADLEKELEAVTQEVERRYAVWQQVVGARQAVVALLKALEKREAEAEKARGEEPDTF